MNSQEILAVVAGENIEYKDKIYIIEYNGRQHYEPIDYFGELINDEEAIININKSDDII